MRKNKNKPETVDTSSVSETEELNVPRKKKKKTGLVVFLIILVLAVAGAAACYFMERQKPISTTRNYLENVQAMNFDGMKNLLQSNDMSALDNADITSEAYTNFFKAINQKMTFEIRKTKFNIQNGTATVTAHIKYIDGSDIYKEAVTEFFQQIASSAFSGETTTAEETQKKLAALLEEKSGSVADKFTETDISYPLIKADGKWKIVSLDDETVKIMSATFVNVQDEITQPLSESGTSDSSATPTSDSSIDMTTDKFAIHYTSCRVTNDYAGNPCILIYYDYTNKNSSPSSAMTDVRLQAIQNGQTLEITLPAEDDTSVDQFISEVNPGQTVNVCQVFSLKDKSDITIQASDNYAIGGGTVTSQILKVQ